jgi:hypothetical protein
MPFCISTKAPLSCNVVQILEPLTIACYHLEDSNFGKGSKLFFFRAYFVGTFTEYIRTTKSKQDT